MSSPATPEMVAPQPNPGDVSVAKEPQLRLWPGVLIIALQWSVVLLSGWLAPGTMAAFMGIMWSPIVGSLLLIVWWLFASRLPVRQRWILFAACAAIGTVAFFISDPTYGFLAMLLYSLPTVTTGWVAWLVVSQRLRWPVRRAGLIVVYLLGWGYFTLLRFDGTTGEFSAEFNYRWKPTAEQKFLAEAKPANAASESSGDALTAEAIELQPGDWPEFRGPARDARLTGVTIATDWKQNPPKELWRHRVGPGWSSFSVVGNRLYTQEQHDQDEAVICYDAETGKELWTHRDPVRFTEVIAGPGPRATPTFHEGKIYAQGAKGTLNCLDAATGKKIWSRDIKADSNAPEPPWGFSASPLVVDGVVSTFAGGPDGKSVLGYDAESGDMKWSSGDGGHSYCSLQRTVLDGIPQLVVTSDAGLMSYDPATGKNLWYHDWTLDQGMSRCTQPTILDNGDILLGAGFGYGLRRVHLTRKDDSWSTSEIWTTRAIKPYYNDLVIEGDYLYGFDGAFFVCVDLEAGKLKWKARGYGNGQVLLLADQKLLLVLSETGAVALLEINPARHVELARFQALEGKTWNHPVVAHGKLFVRNGEEAACFQVGAVQVAVGNDE